ncbi:MAG: hypothetical protein ACK4MQ_00760 [Hyphomonas sp.]
MTLPRLRQLVIAARSLETADQLAEVLGLGEPYIDPGVGVFDLVNRVYAIGDQFLEVVVPLKDTAPAARFIGRGGERGYMVLIQTDDIHGVRARTAAMGIRHVWTSDQKEISATHLHPADIGAAIVSVDTPHPPQSWLWGGPGWDRRTVPGALTGAAFTAKDPAGMAARWAEALGAEARDGFLKLADAGLDFRPGTEDRLTQFRIRVGEPGAAAARAIRLGLDVVDREVKIAGVGIVLED